MTLVLTAFLLHTFDADSGWWIALGLAAVLTLIRSYLT